MESVKSFFAGLTKDAALSNNQQNGSGGLFAGRSTLQAGNALPNNNNTNGNAGAKSVDHQQEVKRTECDSYFYIMWRS